MKNVLKVTLAAAVALLLSFGFSINKSPESIDLVSLQSANAWNFCVDWAPDLVGLPAWQEVSHRFPQSEINRIDAEYPQYNIIADNKQFCMVGGSHVCQNLDIAVSQFEFMSGVFGPKGNENPL